jgi:hypothetical protein
VGRRKLHLGLLNVKKEFPFFCCYCCFYVKKKKKRWKQTDREKEMFFFLKCSQNIRRYERGTTFGRNDPERRDR